jgi:hypothetical protein
VWGYVRWVEPLGVLGVYVRSGVAWVWVVLRNGEGSGMGGWEIGGEGVGRRGTYGVSSQKGRPPSTARAGGGPFGLKSLYVFSCSVREIAVERLIFDRSDQQNANPPESCTPGQPSSQRTSQAAYSTWGVVVVAHTRPPARTWAASHVHWTCCVRLAEWVPPVGGALSRHTSTWQVQSSWGT